MDELRERILVVDDDPSTCDMLSYVFEDQGFAVESHVDSADTLKAVQRIAYDLVVIDLGIQPIDGLSLLKRFRSLPDPPASVVLSGQDKAVALPRAFDLGALDFIAKTVDIGG